MTTVDNRTVARWTLVVIGLVLATLLILELAAAARQVLTWIVIAAFFAVALHPVVTWVENLAGWLKRWLATLIVYLLAVVFIGGLITVFVIPLIHEGTQLANNTPQLIADIKAGRGPVGNLAERFHVLDYIQSHETQIRGYASQLGAPTLTVLRSAATGIAGLVTIFVLSYLMVLEAPKVVNGFLALFSEKRAERIRRVGQDCAKTITGYISGNLLISLICGLLTFGVLAIMQVKYAALIALFVGLTDLIPLIGATLGAVVAVLAGFTHSVTAGIVVIVFFVIYQQLENHLLQPLIFARTVQLNPLAVLLAILIMTELAGILGALLAIPIGGIIQIIARDIWDTRNGRLKRVPTVGAHEDPVPGNPGPTGSVSADPVSIDPVPAGSTAAITTPAVATSTSPASTSPASTSPASTSPASTSPVPTDPAQA